MPIAYHLFPLFCHTNVKNSWKHFCHRHCFHFVCLFSSTENWDVSRARLFCFVARPALLYSVFVLISWKNVWFDEIFHVFTEKCCDLTNFLTRNVWLLAHKIGMAIFLWRFVEFCINSLMIAVLGLGFGKLKHDDEELSLTLGIISWNLDISRQLADVSNQEESCLHQF